MKRYFSARCVDITQSVWRTIVGFFFACHGAASLFGVLGGGAGSGGAVPFGAWPSWWAAVIQLIGGGLVMLGLFTRPAALICSGSMAYAYFVVHQRHGILPIQNSGELSALYAWQFLLIAAIGPGGWSLDNMLRKSRDNSTAANQEMTEMPGTGLGEPCQAVADLGTRNRVFVGANVTGEKGKV